MQRVLDATPMLVSYIDADLRYVYANDTYSTWFGRGADAVIGKTIPEITDRETFARIEPFLRAAQRGERVSYETWVPDENGSIRHVRTELIPDRRMDANDAMPRGFVGVSRDVTLQRRAEEEREAALGALRESEADFRYLGTHAPCLIWSGIVSQIADDISDMMSFFWETTPLDDEAAQAFFPLEIIPGYSYLYTWEIHRLPEDRPRVFQTFRRRRYRQSCRIRCRIRLP